MDTIGPSLDGFSAECETILERLQPTEFLGQAGSVIEEGQ